jgi:hypothetical protein
MMGMLVAFAVALFIVLTVEVFLHFKHQGSLLDADEASEVQPTDYSLREFMLEQDRAYLRKEHEEEE